MTPDTLHLIATMVRNGKGIATAIEKWTQKQEPSSAVKELVQVVAVARGALTVLEGQIGQFSVDDDRAEVEQPTLTGRLSSPSLTRVK